MVVDHGLTSAVAAEVQRVLDYLERMTDPATAVHVVVDDVAVR
jgi:hypothetical protein